MRSGRPRGSIQITRFPRPGAASRGYSRLHSAGRALSSSSDGPTDSTPKRSRPEVTHARPISPHAYFRLEGPFACTSCAREPFRDTIGRSANVLVAGRPEPWPRAQQKRASS